jgi:hypothetical protein
VTRAVERQLKRRADNRVGHRLETLPLPGSHVTQKGQRNVKIVSGNGAATGRFHERFTAANKLRTQGLVRPEGEKQSLFFFLRKRLTGDRRLTL